MHNNQYNYIHHIRYNQKRIKMYQENLIEKFLFRCGFFFVLPIQLSIDKQKTFFDGATINLRTISNVNQELPRKKKYYCILIISFFCKFAI
jgi:hypothetical protein